MAFQACLGSHLLRHSIKLELNFLCVLCRKTNLRHSCCSRPEFHHFTLAQFDDLEMCEMGKDSLQLLDFPLAKVKRYFI